MTDQTTQQKKRIISATATPKNRLWEFLAFLFFVALISILYLQNRHSWKNEIAEQQILIDSLTSQIQLYADRVNELEQTETTAINSIRSHTFNSFDTDFRIYGLFKTANKSQTRESISQRFNVYNASAIKYSDVLGERWFIVPVKGIHRLKEGESLGQLATLYYKKSADSVLLHDFNPIIAPQRVVFLPFDY